MDLRKLKFGQLNLQNSRIATSEARTLFVNLGISVLLVQEPYTHANRIKGFGLQYTTVTGPGQNRPQSGIIFSPNLSIQALPQYGNSHFTTCQISMKNDSIYLVSAYFQFGHGIVPYIEKLRSIVVALSGRKILIAVDANARSALWHNDETNERGMALEDLLLDQNLFVLNQANQPPTHQAGGNIDVTLVSASLLAQMGSWRVNTDESCSDHRLITFDLSLERPATIPLKGYSIKNADYTKLNQLLGELLERNHPSDDSVEKACLFQKLLEKACKLSLKPRSNRISKVPWWNSELTAIKREVARARRRMQRTCDQGTRDELRQIFIRKRRKMKIMIKEAKNKSWQEFVRTSFSNDPYGIVFKLASDKIEEKSHYVSLQRQDGSLTEDSRETVAELMNSLLPRDNVVEETRLHADIRARALRPYKNHNISQPFSSDEIINAIKSAKPRKCPGPDLVPIDVIKNLNESNREVLLGVYNDLWTEGQFPPVWKRARVTFIPKGGNRDPSMPKSYRPISLLPTVGKTFERLIAARLKAHLNDYNLSSKSQHGFKEGHSTETAIKEMLEYVNTSNKKHVIAIFLDVQGAFDGAWWPSILVSLKKLKIPRNIYQTLVNYLKDRHILVQHNDTTIERVVDKGCPQGSVLGPLLWNIIFDGLLRIENEERKIIAYADDAVMLLQSNTRAGLENAFNNSVILLRDWAEAAKLKFAPEKTQALHLKGRLPGRYPILRLEEHRVQFKSNVKHLGIYIDKERRFIEHAKRVSDKARVVILKVTRVAKLKYGITPKSYHLLYKTVFVPIITYAESIWADRVSHSLVKRALRSSQRRALRSMLGAYSTVSGPALCVLAGEPPLDLKFKEISRLRMCRKGLLNLTPREVREDTIREWQTEWDESTKGRHTYEIYPLVKLNKEFKYNLDHFTTQIASGHGACRAYLHKIGLLPSPDCEWCGVGTHETIRHTLIDCPKWQLTPEKTSLMEAGQTANIPWPPTMFQILSTGPLRDAARKLMKVIAWENRGLSQEWAAPL